VKDMWISDPHPVVTDDIRKMNCFTRLYSYSARTSELRETESIVFVCAAICNYCPDRQSYLLHNCN